MGLFLIEKALEYAINDLKDPPIEFKKNDKYVYPDFEVYSMKVMDREFVLKEIVPTFLQKYW